MNMTRKVFIDRSHFKLFNKNILKSSIGGKTFSYRQRLPYIVCGRRVVSYEFFKTNISLSKRNNSIVHINIALGTVVKHIRGPNAYYIRHRWLCTLLQNRYLPVFVAMRCLRTIQDTTNNILTRDCVFSTFSLYSYGQYGDKEASIWP